MKSSEKEKNRRKKTQQPSFITTFTNNFGNLPPFLKIRYNKCYLPIFHLFQCLLIIFLTLIYFPLVFVSSQQMFQNFTNLFCKSSLKESYPNHSSDLILV